MDRQSQDARVAVERALGAVAVVHVPVNHRDTFEPPDCPRMVHRDCPVSEQAKAHGLIRQCMVPRRAQQGVGVVHIAVEHGVNCGNGATRSKGGNVEASRPHRCARADLTTFTSA